MPFVHRHQLYVSYSLCPHTVLAVDIATGHCTLAHETRAPDCDKHHRGSASGVAIDSRAGSVVGLAHTKGAGVGRMYTRAPRS